MKFLAVLSLLLVASAVFAGPPGSGGASTDRLVQELGLDDAQAAQVREIFAGQRDRMRSLRELPESERRAEMQRIRSDVDAQLEGVLSAEQMQKFEALRQDARRNRGGGKRGRYD